MDDENRIELGLESRALIGKQAFCRYLGVSSGWFYRLIDAGLPAEKRQGRWVGNKDQVDRWFRIREAKGGSPPGAPAPLALSDSLGAL